VEKSTARVPPTGRIVTLKRDCSSGRFVPLARRALGCAIKDQIRQDWTRPQPGDREDRVCYTSKGAALRIFIAANRDQVERWGLDTLATGGEFDAVNERYKLKKRVSKLRDALWAVMPAGRPFCLDRLDLDTLNETAPALEGEPFRLPDVVAEHRLAQQYAHAQEDNGDLPF
jgi:hypothetical protein